MKCLDWITYKDIKLCGPYIGYIHKRLAKGPKKQKKPKEETNLDDFVIDSEQKAIKKVDCPCLSSSDCTYEFNISFGHPVHYYHCTRK